MPDWTKGMIQTYEYYRVDPYSWLDTDKLENFTSASISRDESNETLGSATFDCTDELGEIYVRVYLKTIQNEIEEKTSLGTFLIQTPHDRFDGRVHSFSYDAYTPLLELKDALMPLGYYVPKGNNVMEAVNAIMADVLRAPVIPGNATDELLNDFIAEDSDTYLSFLSDLVSNANQSIGLDELSRVIFVPNQELTSMQPIWTYDDSNSSILYPDASRERDLYGIPNVVEVVYSSSNGGTNYVRIVNDDPDSPTSTVTRGREIIHRDTSPSFNGNPSDEEIEEYAVQLLKSLSTLEYTISYKHGYCPVRVGDCVMINYDRAGYSNIKAKVISQSISCEPGCPVDETAVYTVKMWE